MNDRDSWRGLYPFESHYQVIDGLRYHYLDEGQGAAVLLVHGNPTWSFYWREVVKSLRHRHRVIAVDHIGCGLSDKPPAGRYGYRLENRIDNLVALIRHLDLNEITLVAHDWGGAIGMGAATRVPERFARFALLNTAAFRGGRCPWRIRVCRTPVLGKAAVQGMNLFARAALTMAVSRRARMKPAVRAGLLAPYDSWQHREAVYRFVEDIPLNSSHPSYATLAAVEAGLAQFREHPVALLWGMRDWCFTPQFLARFEQFFPRAEVHRFGDAGHYVVEDAWERVVPILEEFCSRPMRL